MRARARNERHELLDEFTARDDWDGPWGQPLGVLRLGSQTEKFRRATSSTYSTARLYWRRARPSTASPFGNAGTSPETVVDAAFDDPQFDGLQVVLDPGFHQLRMELRVLAGGFVVQTGVRLDTLTSEVPALGAAGCVALGLALSLTGIMLSRRRMA